MAQGGHVGGPVRGEGGDGMKFKVKFPVRPGTRNHKAIREAILLDTTGNSFEETLFAAAERAAGPDQKVYVSRSYGPAGRFSVIISDEGSGSRMERRKALQAMLGRVSV